MRAFRPGRAAAAGAPGRNPATSRPGALAQVAPLLPVALLLALLVLPRGGIPGAESNPAEAAPDGFRRAEGARRWVFPRDHGQHPDYRLEWWYYTGIVSAADGRRFGYQVTFFRQGLAGARAERASAWAVRSLYLAHAAVSDVGARRFLPDSRVGRDSLALSGASRAGHAVWLGDWRAAPLPDDPHGVSLAVAATEFALSLELRAEKPPVLHGEGGLDRKGDGLGQASWYYSLPRLATVGTLRVGDETHAVRGVTWMDHEFGTARLAPELAGWDWLALRLEDGSDLMLYRLRRRDGSASGRSSGSLIAPDGARTPLRVGDAPPDGGTDSAGDPPSHPARMIPDAAPGAGTWRSPRTGAAYPLAWRIEVPAAALTLRVTPLLEAQEQPAGPGTPFSYWEGAVEAAGTRAGRPLRGEGYLELTGYAGDLGGALR